MFFCCLFGTFLGHLLYDLYFNKKVDEKVVKNFEKRWFD